MAVTLSPGVEYWTVSLFTRNAPPSFSSKMLPMCGFGIPSSLRGVLWADRAGGVVDGAGVIDAVAFAMEKAGSGTAVGVASGVGAVSAVESGA